LSELDKTCAKTGRKLAVEFLPRTCIGHSVEELLELMADRSNTTIGVCLDVNHLMGHYAELPAYVRRLGPHLLSLHLSDCDAIDEKHWMPGKGVIDWKALMATLKEIRFDGPLNYECPLDGGTWDEKVQSLDRNIECLLSL
jgi:sugar phosphate isomerase/epimerase